MEPFWLLLFGMLSKQSMNKRRGKFGVQIVMNQMSDQFACKVLQAVDWISQASVLFRIPQADWELNEDGAHGSCF